MIINFNDCFAGFKAILAHGKINRFTTSWFNVTLNSLSSQHRVNERGLCRHHSLVHLCGSSHTGGHGLVLHIHLNGHLLHLIILHFNSLTLKFSSLDLSIMSVIFPRFPDTLEVNGASLFTTFLNFEPIVKARVAQGRQFDSCVANKFIAHNRILVHDAHVEIITNVFDIEDEILIEFRLLTLTFANL